MQTGTSYLYRTVNTADDLKMLPQVWTFVQLQLASAVLYVCAAAIACCACQGTLYVASLEHA